ncbi:MarR family winged helix-turn-helix transcriptional regulator [Mesorhizobium sp. 10J20-29]
MSTTRKEMDVWMHCSNSAVRRAARQLGQLYGGVLGASDLRSTQFSLLSQIASSGEPTLKSLAGAMVMDLSALGHTLKPLLRDGMVEMLPDPHDKRVKRVRLTAEGEARRGELMAAWRDAQDRFDSLLGREKSEELRRTLAQIGSPEFAAAFAAAGKGK